MERIRIKEKLIFKKNFALVRECSYNYLILYGRKWINNFFIAKTIINALKNKNFSFEDKELILLGIEPYLAYILSFLFKKIIVVDDDFELIEFTKFHKGLWEKNNVEIIGSDFFDYLKKLDLKNKNKRIIIFISKPNQNIIFYSKPFLKGMKEKSKFSIFINKTKNAKKEFQTNYITKRLKELKINFIKIEKDILLF